MITIGRVLQTSNEIELNCPSTCLELHPFPFNVYVLHFPHKSTMRVHAAPSPIYITVLITCALSSSSTERNKINGHISLYRHLTLIVLLHIKINTLNSATSRQATRVVDNTIYQQKLECPNGYNGADYCVNMLVIDSIEFVFINCGLI